VGMAQSSLGSPELTSIDYLSYRFSKPSRWKATHRRIQTHVAWQSIGGATRLFGRGFRRQPDGKDWVSEEGIETGGVQDG
jgi:hypothetical protein